MGDNGNQDDALDNSIPVPESFGNKPGSAMPELILPTGPEHDVGQAMVELSGVGINTEMPVDLQHLFRELKLWANANRQDAIRDTIAFWSLKLPAMISAASAGVWAHFGWPSISVIAGAIATLCVIIDGVHPRGMLRNIHLRAFHDLRNLMAKMMSEWRTRRGRASSSTVAKRIIRRAEAERVVIATYIRDAEAALDYHTPTRSGS